MRNEDSLGAWCEMALFLCAHIFYLMTVVCLFLHVIMVALPWMRTGQWGDYPTVADVT